MFNSLKHWRTFVFLDVSNIFYMQYTLWRKFRINLFLPQLDQDKTISKTLVFWAYSKELPKQVERVEELNTKYWSKDNFLINFKELRLKGNKNKGNVDTEIVYEALSEVNNYDTMILFSWDWDFAYIARKLVKEHNKKIFIFSTPSFVGAEIYELERELWDATKFAIYDINSDTEVTCQFLKQIVRWELFLFPELVQYYKSLDSKWLTNHINFIQDMINWTLKNAQLFETETTIEKAFLELKAKNWDYILPILKKWKKADKERLMHHLKTLL